MYISKIKPPYTDGFSCAHLFTVQIQNILNICMAITLLTPYEGKPRQGDSQVS